MTVPGTETTVRGTEATTEVVIEVEAAELTEEEETIEEDIMVEMEDI